MARLRRCRRCGRPVMDDGYGELTHEGTGLYLCADDGMETEEDYPVAA